MCALTSVMAERRGVREAWEKQARTHTWECNTTRAPRHVPRSTPWVFMLPLLLRATGSAAASSRAGMQACDVRTCTSGACDMQPATLALLWPMPVAGVSMPRVRSEGLRLLRLLLWCRTDGPTGSGRVLAMDMRPPNQCCGTWYAPAVRQVAHFAAHPITAHDADFSIPIVHIVPTGARGAFSPFSRMRWRNVRRGSNRFYSRINHQSPSQGTEIDRIFCAFIGGRSDRQGHETQCSNRCFPVSVVGTMRIVMCESTRNGDAQPGHTASTALVLCLQPC